MPIHDPRPPRLPAASNALLSAALGGLMSLAPGCRPGDGGASDGGAPDVGTSDVGTSDVGTVDIDARASDAGADAPEAEDASPAEDTSPDPTDGAVTDASDASTLMDASVPIDTNEPADAAVHDTFCEVDPAPVITITDAAPGITLEAFTAMCDGLGGVIEIHPHCGGMNSCRGISYDSGTGVLTEHTCAGLNTCTGFSCVIP